MSFEYTFLKDSDVFTKSDQYVAIFSDENPFSLESIGFPGHIGFGLGVAKPEILQGLKLHELPGTRDRNSFQYALYEFENPADDVKTITPDGTITVNGTTLPETDTGTDVTKTITQSYRAYFKYIPRFYVKLLSRSDEVLMTEEELEQIAPYVGVTVQQMLDAQTKAGTAALVISRPGAFSSKEEATLHGFTYLDGFIDNGKEVDGFFIQNTLPMYYASTDGTNSDTIYYFGHPEFKFSPKSLYAEKKLGIVRCDDSNPKKEFGLNPSQRLPESIAVKFPGTNLITVHMLAVLRILEFMTMLYCQPSWDNSVRGINTNGSTDADDESVLANSNVSTDTGDIWTQSEDMHLKTTHNGEINGVTNLNGWLKQMVLGANSSWQMIMNRDRLLSEVTLDDALSDGGIAAPQIVSGAVWGKGAYNQPWYRDDPHLFGVVPYNGTSRDNPETIFGEDDFTAVDGTDVAVFGKTYKDGKTAGIFSSGWSSNFDDASPMVSFRLALYPNGNDAKVSLIPDTQGGLNMDPVHVNRGSIWEDVKGLIAEPSFEGHKFKYWSLTINGDEIKNDTPFNDNTVIKAVWQ